MGAKDWLKRTLQNAGLEVSISDARTNILRNCVWHCRKRHVDLCLDVGANTGQFAMTLRRYGYRGDILSFEPLSAAYSELQSVASKDPRWRCAPRMALGSTIGEAEINIASNSVSSSLLPISDVQVESAQESHYVGREKTPVSTLDAFCAETRILERYKTLFLKLDTQGYEQEILKGANGVMGSVSLLLLEMALVPLYEGAASFVDLYKLSEEKGFQCIYLSRGFQRNDQMVMLEVDGLFARMR